MKSKLRKTSVIGKCKICGEKTHTNISSIKTNRYLGKYCSIKCRNLDPEYRKSCGNGKDKKIQVDCAFCGKTVLRHRFEAIKNTRYFCDNKCKGNYFSGKRSHRWKGENAKTPELMRIRYSDKYKEWRQKIFIRDDFTCQECGVRGVCLEVHHKRSFKSLVDDIGNYLPLLSLYEGAMVYTPLWDVSNGVTLCKKCHNKFRNKKEKTHVSPG